MKCVSRLALVLCLACFSQLNLFAEDKDEKAAPDGPWVSSLIWDGDEIIGTKSQGLLLRPAEVFRTSAKQKDELEKIAEAPTSLWATLRIDGSSVVVSDYKGGLHIVQGDASEPVELESRWIRAICASPDADHFLAGTEDGKLVVVSIKDKKEIKRIDAHEAAIFDIEFNSAGDQLATAGGDGKVKLFSWPELEPQATMTRGEEAVWCLSYTQDGSHLVSGGADRRIQLWDVAAKSSVLTITKTRDWITDLKLLPESSLFVASCMDGKLVVADADSMLRVAEVEAAESGIWCMDLNDDASQIALGTRKHGIVLADVQDWKTTAAKLAVEAAKRAPPIP